MNLARMLDNRCFHRHLWGILDAQGRIMPFLLFLFYIGLEIAGFILVGERIGVLATLAIIVLSGMSGLFLMREMGFAGFNRIRQQMERGETVSAEIGSVLMVFVGGLLLVIPGFVSDSLGLLLLIAPVRTLLWQRFSGKAHIFESHGGFQRHDHAHGPRGRVVDLDEEDWSRQGTDRPDPSGKALPRDRRNGADDRE